MYVKIKKSGVVIIILLIIFSISITGCISNEESGPDWKQEGKYIATITPEINDTYSIIIPVVVEQDGRISNVMKNLKISEGEGNIDIRETEKGFGLFIESSSPITVESKIDRYKGKDDIVYDVLSFERDTDYNGNVDVDDITCAYYNLPNGANINSLINIEITFNGTQSAGESGADLDSRCYGYVKINGEWQLIGGHRLVDNWDEPW
jgi:hypothetical protein